MIICNTCLYYVADPGINKVGAQTLDEWGGGARDSEGASPRIAYRGEYMISERGSGIRLAVKY